MTVFLSISVYALGFCFWFTKLQNAAQTSTCEMIKSNKMVDALKHKDVSKITTWI